MKQLLIVIPVIFLSACAPWRPSEWSTEAKVEEAAYQIIAAYDIAQSVQGAKNPRCYQESAPGTSALIGSHPSVGGVLAFGVARAGVHALVTNWIQSHNDDDNAVLFANRFFQFVSLAVEIDTVRSNSSIGLRFGSARPPADAPCLQHAPLSQTIPMPRRMP